MPVPGAGNTPASIALFLDLKILFVQKDTSKI
jgi:hypothetical protein